jgi:hypothetical protein
MIMLAIIQTCLQSSNLGQQFPVFQRIEDLIKKNWYNLTNETQFMIMNIYTYFKVDSDNFEKEFSELNEALFFSDK